MMYLLSSFTPLRHQINTLDQKVDVECMTLKVQEAALWQN